MIDDRGEGGWSVFQRRKKTESNWSGVRSQSDLSNHIFHSSLFRFFSVLLVFSPRLSVWGRFFGFSVDAS